MQIKLIETGEVMNVAAFYDLHPGVGFAQPITDEVLADFGAHVYTPPVIVPPIVVRPLTMADVQKAVQERLDEFARTRNYDSILSACTYVTSAVPKFKAEGEAAIQARDAAWHACYGILTEVQGGARPMPTLDEVLAELPALLWSE
ncbi:hypothetical protein VLK31_28170 [Variovorax sp. H27-G14]|uniref:hypothetical protein n=1 Tax=Variovorax sp. H27-G14 TaxID=3111914 RepID=UPI0038FC86DB